MNDALLSHVIDHVRAGWVKPDPRQPVDEAMLERARVVWERTRGEDGEKLLRLIADLSVLRPVVDHRLTGADYTAYAQLRQGQDTIFASLIRYRDAWEDHLKQRKDHATRTEHPDAGSGGDPERPDAGNAQGGGWDWSGFDPAGDIAGR